MGQRAPPQRKCSGAERVCVGFKGVGGEVVEGEVGQGAEVHTSALHRIGSAYICFT